MRHFFQLQQINVLGGETVDRVHVVVTHVSTLSGNVLGRHGEWESSVDCG
jgi:hypothetical protein